MTADRSYIQQNDRELARMRALVGGLSTDDLDLPVNDEWTVAGVLGHIAFWDGVVLSLAARLDRDGSLTSSEEPEDVDWINDAARPLIHAIPPADLARLALRIAEDTDQRVASLDPAVMYPEDPDSQINSLRATHRGEHLDEIETALARNRGTG